MFLTLCNGLLLSTRDQLLHKNISIVMADPSSPIEGATHALYHHESQQAKQQQKEQQQQ